MKVLVYLWMYPPYRYTGGEVMTAKLLEHLVQCGNEVDVYAEHVYDKYTRNGVLVQNSGYLYKQMSDEYDVFITHPEIRTGVWSHVQRMPYVGIVHNISPNTLRSLERQPPHLTIANSHYTERHITLTAKHRGMGVHVLHPPTLIEPIGGKHSSYTMVNISLEKGGSVLNYVAHQNKSLKFTGVLGGHGLQVENQPNNVTLLGPTNDMQSIYADTKALLFPTHSETYGMVVGEAMQFGIPVIASNLPGIVEAAGDAALYVDPYDYAGWNEAVRSMESPSVYKEWHEASKNRGTFLHRRSLDDLDRWVTLVEEVTKFDERRKR